MCFWYVTVRYLTDEELEELLNNSNGDLSDVEEEYAVPQGDVEDSDASSDEKPAPKKVCATENTNRPPSCKKRKMQWHRTS